MRKIKKIKVHKMVKWGIMVGLIGLVGLLSFLYIQESQRVNTAEEEKALYEYSYKTDIKYAVNLIQNVLYEEDKLGEDEVYLAELIRSINNHFTVSFTGSEPAKISGKYKVDAQVVGYTTAEKESQAVKRSVWDKSFELIPEQTFEGEGETFEVQKTAEVNYKSYNDFAKEIVKTTKANIPMELHILVTGEMIAQTPYETIEKPIQLITRMPLDVSHFSIATQGEGELKDAIKETEIITLPPDQDKLISYLIGIGLAVVVFLLVGVLTIPQTAEDIKRNYMRNLLVTYGNRMIGVKVIGDVGYTAHYEVVSLEDLVKIADELEQPVLYEVNEDVLAIQKFYVMYQQSIYSYILEDQGVKEVAVKEEKKEPVIEQIAGQSIEM